MAFIAHRQKADFVIAQFFGASLFQAPGLGETHSMSDFMISLHRMADSSFNAASTARPLQNRQRLEPFPLGKVYGSTVKLSGAIERRRCADKGAR